MTQDHGNWAPLSVQETAELLSSLSVAWWIAGGQAIDLFVGRETRLHGDTDVLIRPDDQLVVQRHLAGWDLHKTKQPGLAPWPDGEFLGPPVNDVWCRRTSGSPWQLQFMLLDTDGEDWVFRRDRAIRGPMDGLGRRTPEGVPYLAPEIQLLYKARSEVLEKDAADFANAVPLLDASARDWLLRCLERRFPAEHPWISALRERVP